MYHAYPHYVIKNVELWTAEGVEKGRDVEVHEGTVVSIHPSSEYASPITIIDGTGLVLMPAGVDPQVHLLLVRHVLAMEPGDELLRRLLAHQVRVMAAAKVELPAGCRMVGHRGPGTDQGNRLV